MAGRPKRRARLAKSTGAKAIAKTVTDYVRSSSGGRCPKGDAVYVIAGRSICVSSEVDDWVKTGNGRGFNYTRNGTPAMARADLETAVRKHIALERKHADHLARHGMNSKFETRSMLVDDDYGQGIWLEIFTSAGRGSYSKGLIVVNIDHG